MLIFQRSFWKIKKFYKVEKEWTKGNEKRHKNETWKNLNKKEIRLAWAVVGDRSRRFISTTFGRSNKFPALKIYTFPPLFLGRFFDFISGFLSSCVERRPNSRDHDQDVLRYGCVLCDYFSTHVCGTKRCGEMKSLCCDLMQRVLPSSARTVTIQRSSTSPDAVFRCEFSAHAWVCAPVVVNGGSANARGWRARDHRGQGWKLKMDWMDGRRKEEGRKKGLGESFPRFLLGPSRAAPNNIRLASRVTGCWSPDITGAWWCREVAARATYRRRSIFPFLPLSYAKRSINNAINFLKCAATQMGRGGREHRTVVCIIGACV